MAGVGLESPGQCCGEAVLPPQVGAGGQQSAAVPPPAPPRFHEQICDRCDIWPKHLSRILIRSQRGLVHHHPSQQTRQGTLAPPARPRREPGVAATAGPRWRSATDASSRLRRALRAPVGGECGGRRVARWHSCRRAISAASSGRAGRTKASAMVAERTGSVAAKQTEPRGTSGENGSASVAGTLAEGSEDSVVRCVQRRPGPSDDGS